LGNYPQALIDIVSISDHYSFMRWFCAGRLRRYAKTPPFSSDTEGA
jgi:hypothetical protein